MTMRLSVRHDSEEAKIMMPSAQSQAYHFSALIGMDEDASERMLSLSSALKASLISSTSLGV